MHEWALAEAVLATALKTAAQAGFTRITRIEVIIGELQQIEEELFAQALSQVMPVAEPALAGVDIRLRTEPALARCRVCQHDFPLAPFTAGMAPSEAEAVHFVPELAHAWVRCPSCDSPDFEVASGRGVWIEAIEGSS